MKYVLMFTHDPAQDAVTDPALAQAAYAEVWSWFGEHADQIADGGAELHPVSTATTVRGSATGERVVVDGPFSEAKEVIGGFSIIDVPDLDAAIELTKTWPMLKIAGAAVEIRPMVTDYSQFEG